MKEGKDSASLFEKGSIKEAERMRFQLISSQEFRKDENPLWKNVQKNSSKYNPKGLNENGEKQIDQNISSSIKRQEKQNYLSNYFELQNNGDSIEETINPKLKLLEVPRTPNLNERINREAHSSGLLNDLENSNILSNSDRGFQANSEVKKIELEKKEGPF